MSTKPLPYRDSSLSVDQRVGDLLSRMSLEEKIAQLGCRMWSSKLLDTRTESPLSKGIGQIAMVSGGETAAFYAEAIAGIQRYLCEKTRLGIPAIIHAEALSGGMLPEHANFPGAIGLAAAWDPESIQAMGEVIRRQCLAIGVRQVLSPLVDVDRDARWGRIGETYGEDPTLVARLAVAYVTGVQGNELKNGVAATAKHFLGYAMGEGGLNMCETRLPPRVLREVYAKPFAAVIQKARIASVMNAYSSLDGEPIVSSKAILTDLLRGELGFDGLTVSDYMSIGMLVSSFKTASDPCDAGIQALSAGMDMELPDVIAYGACLREAVESGRVETALIDRSVLRVLELKFRLGLFERPVPAPEDRPGAFRQTADFDLSRRLACESLVLLKNEGPLLPLSRALKKVAVIGPNSDTLRNLFGGYSYPAFLEMILGMSAMLGIEVPEGTEKESLESRVEKLDRERLPGMYPQSATVVQAIRRAIPHAEVLHVPGCPLTGGDRSGFAKAVEAAKKAGLAIMAVGDKDGCGEFCTTGEGRDSSSLALPGVQEELIRAVHATGVPIVIVHVSPRPLSSPWISNNVAAILQAWHPGQCAGEAIASALFGDCNPGGKLPITAPRSAGQVPAYCAHPRGSGYAGRGTGPFTPRDGYVNESLQPLYYFGHGLSYTSFGYDGFSISEDRVATDAAVVISCAVCNTGKRAGDEVVQLYMSDTQSSRVRPVKELMGFKRLRLQPGEKKAVVFTVHVNQLAFLDSEMNWIIEPGEIAIHIGSSSEDIRLRGRFTITGQTRKINGLREYYAAVSTAQEE